MIRLAGYYQDGLPYYYETIDIDPNPENRLKPIIKADITQARQLLEKAAKTKDANALFALGQFYQIYGKEDGIPDQQSALNLYKEAAEQGNINALKQLGSFYFNAALGNPENEKTAIVYYQKAFELGSTQAYVELGHQYLGEEDCHSEACENLGRLRNAKKALYYFEQAANEGNIAGLNQLYNYCEADYLIDYKPEPGCREKWLEKARKLGYQLRYEYHASKPRVEFIVDSPDGFIYARSQPNSQSRIIQSYPNDFKLNTTTDDFVLLDNGWYQINDPDQYLSHPNSGKFEEIYIHQSGLRKIQP